VGKEAGFQRSQNTNECVSDEINHILYSFVSILREVGY